MKDLVLKGNRVHLEHMVDRLTPEELQHYLNDEDQVRFMTGVPYPYTVEDANQFFKYLKYAKANKSAYELGIFNNENNEFMGVMSLENVDNENQNAEIGYWIRKQFWGKGYAKEAAETIIEFGFNELNLYRLYAYVIKENTPSLALLSSIGFQIEGLGRKFRKNKGSLIDMYHLSLLKDEWKGKLNFLR